MSRKLSEQRSLSRRFSGVTMPISRRRAKWNRNWLCICESGKKYKHCCMDEINSFTAHDGNANIEVLPESVQKMIDTHREKKDGYKRK